MNMGRLHPKWNGSVVRWPIIAAVVLLFILVPIVLLGFEKSYSGFSSKYTADQAGSAFKEKKFDEAASLLERLALTHPLDLEQKKLLNDIYFARADQRAAMLNYAAAIADLNKISADFGQMSMVTVKHEQFSKLLNAQQAENKNGVDSKAQFASGKRKRNSRLSSNAAGQTMVQSDATAMNNGVAATQLGSAAIQPASTTAQGRSRAWSDPSVATNRASAGAHAIDFASSNFTGPARSVANVLSVSDSLSNPVKSNSNPRFEITSVGGSVLPSSKTSQASSGATAPKGDGASAPQNENANIPDMVRYNELLAGYFSQERKHSSASSEPPTFKEWIDQKRPNF